MTEICAGAYAALDGGLAEAGVCAPDEVALSVAPVYFVTRRPR